MAMRNSICQNMVRQKINSLTVWFFENLFEYEGIRHFISTRTGGCSVSPWESFNLSFNVEDDPQNVLKNRKLLAASVGFSLAGLTTAKQIHDCHVKIVSESLRGKGGSDYKGAIDATDAMVTNGPGICLMVLVADCVPILFYDPVRSAIGVAHAGWKGTLRWIAQKTVKVFQEQFGSSPKDILACIGPSIGPCCYQVGQEVISQVKDVFGTKAGYVRKESSDGKGYFDLWTANLGQLLQVGIPEKNIEVARVCTCDHPYPFFSYRRENAKTGRFGAGIVIC